MSAVATPTKPRRTISFSETLEDPQLFGKWFSEPSWDVWKAIARATDGEPLSQAQRAALAKVAGGRTEFAAPVREAWHVHGRRSGKSVYAAARGVHAAAFNDYRPHLKPGERAAVMIVAADRDQAQVVFRYVEGFFDEIPMLGAMVVPGGRQKESIELANRTVIQVQTCNYRRVRGRTVCCAIFDEASVWFNDAESRNPDTEVLAAVRPAMVTIPNSRLYVISSPYARKGIVWDAYRRYYGADDPGVLVTQSDTLTMNPSVDRAFVEEEYRKDEASACAEWGGLFRTDIEDFISPEVVEACTVKGRTWLPYEPGMAHYAYADFAGGSGQDSAALAIARREGDRGVVVLVLEWRPPFDATVVAQEIAEALRRHGLASLMGDKFSGATWQAIMRAAGVRYEFSERTTSDVFHDALPLLTSRRVELLDHGRANAQVCGLERTTSRLGKDTISHGPGGHDDLAAAVLGAALRAQRRRMFEDLGDVERARHPEPPAAPGDALDLLLGPGWVSADGKTAEQVMDELRGVGGAARPAGPPPEAPPPRPAPPQPKRACSECGGRVVVNGVRVDGGICQPCQAKAARRAAAEAEAVARLEAAKASLASAITFGTAYKPMTEPRTCACTWTFDAEPGSAAVCPRCGGSSFRVMAAP